MIQYNSITQNISNVKGFLKILTIFCIKYVKPIFWLFSEKLCDLMLLSRKVAVIWVLSGKLAVIY